jgi:hypothetical protein
MMHTGNTVSLLMVMNASTKKQSESLEWHLMLSANKKA